LGSVGNTVFEAFVVVLMFEEAVEELVGVVAVSEIAAAVSNKIVK
jgi:hypothetical protein